eukprot:COSAG06_NODE_4491_length_4208_cov_2.975176_4_plen_56_part_00
MIEGLPVCAAILVRVRSTESWWRISELWKTNIPSSFPIGSCTPALNSSVATSGAV